MGIGLSILIGLKAAILFSLFAFLRSSGFTPDKLPPRNPKFSGHSYLCVATWDTRAPPPAAIESAVKWACRKRDQNRHVFVHCTYAEKEKGEGINHDAVERKKAKASLHMGSANPDALKVAGNRVE
ncbi:hypothetical protein ACFX2A_044908 [Malus domestica]